MLRLRHVYRSQSRAFSFRNGPRRNLAAPPTVRHVRFRRPWIRSFFTKFFLYGAAFHLWTSFVLGRFDDDTDDNDLIPEPSLEGTGPRRSPRGSDRSAEEGREEESKDGVSTFIPLTWPRLRDGELYDTSDPEWQTIFQLSEDKKQMQKLTDELAEFIMDMEHSRLSSMLGGPSLEGDFEFRVHCPPRAPPEYFRSGLEITDKGITWVTKTLDPEIGDRLQRYMMPVHVVLAIRDAWLVLLRRQANRLWNHQEQPVDALESLNESYTLSRTEKLNPLRPHDQPRLQPPVSNGPPASAPSSNGDPALHPSSILSSLQRLPLPDLGPGSDLHLASNAFRLRVNEYRARMKPTHRRGVLSISGDVAIVGSRAICLLEVQAGYDPFESKFRTVEVTFTDIKTLEQVHEDLKRALGNR